MVVANRGVDFAIYRHLTILDELPDFEEWMTVPMGRLSSGIRREMLAIDLH